MDSDQEFHAKTLFYQGSYAACHATIESMSDPPYKSILFSARSLIALKKPKLAIDLLKKHCGTEPSARAITLLANYYIKPTLKESEREKLSEEVEGLIDEISDEENDGTDSILRVSLASILILIDNVTLAVFLLKQGVQLHSLESVALLISLYLSPKLRRTDLARKLYRSVKSWADDAILLQMAEAWIGATTGSAAANVDGKEPGGYQSAFYVFDEIANTNSDQPQKINIVGLNGKAVTQLAMGHIEEAQANLAEALKAAPEDETTLANSIVISAHVDSSISNATTHLEKLKSINPLHPLIVDIEKQESLFDEAASKFITQTV